MKASDIQNATGIVRPRLTIYHTKSNGTGSAVLFEMVPAHGYLEGAIYARIATQAVKGDKTFFNWEEGITVKLNFDSICKILQVFRGECESIDGDKGIVIEGAKATYTVKLNHLIEPVCGYRFSVRKDAKDANDSANNNWCDILFSSSEALGLCEVFTQSLSEIAFGTGFEATALNAAIDEEIARQQEENGPNCYSESKAEDLRASVPAKDGNSAGKSADPLVPTEDEYNAAYKSVIASVGAEYAPLITGAFNAVRDGKPLNEAQFAAAVSILGKDNKVVVYADLIRNLDAAYNRVLEYFGEEYRARIDDAFRRVRTAPSLVTVEEINYGAEALGEDNPLVKFFRDLNRND